MNPAEFIEFVFSKFAPQYLNTTTVLLYYLHSTTVVLPPQYYSITVLPPQYNSIPVLPPQYYSITVLPPQYYNITVLPPLYYSVTVLPPQYYKGTPKQFDSGGELQIWMDVCFGFISPIPLSHATKKLDMFFSSNIFCCTDKDLFCLSHWVTATNGFFVCRTESLQQTKLL